MGQKSFEIKRSIETDKKHKQELVEKEDPKSKEAEDWQKALLSIELIDDEDEWAILAAGQSPKGVDRKNKFSISQIIQNYEDSKDDSTDQQLESLSINDSIDIQPSGQEFLEFLEENNHQESNEMQTTDQIVADLEDVF